MYGSACKPREPSAAVSRNLSRRAERVAGGSAAPSPCSGVTPAVWGQTPSLSAELAPGSALWGCGG